MAAQILDGRALARTITEQLRPRADAVAQRRGRPVGLAAILVGADAASEVYVRRKMQAAARVGLTSEVVRLPADASQAQLHAAIDALNADARIDAYLVQLPLPAHLDVRAALGRIDARKDADGLHPVHVGALAGGAPTRLPCTPAGCMRLIAETSVKLTGAHAVVVGRSGIVGRPLAQLLLRADATVTVCHAATVGLAEHTRRADILISATGVPGLITAEHLRPGVVVIDVGIARISAGGETRLCGDVDAAAAQALAAYTTPVPGGVGPMTVAMLLCNAVEAAEAAAAHGAGATPDA